MEEIKVRELAEKSSVSATDYALIEDLDGTKRVLVKHFRSLILTSLFFNNIDELKNSSDISLREGDICETLGYYVPGDGGGAKYKITYNPTAVEDGKLVHYLSYSDTLRAELVQGCKINVHQFGAVGDGKHDDTDAIQAAIDHSDTKVIEFNNNMKYVTRDTLVINKSNTILNGNGSIIYPHYADGIKISPKEDIDSPIHNVIINDLHFDCSKAFSAIYAYRATKVDINESYIDNITTKGINLKNCTFVNIDKCMFNGSNSTNSSILLEGIDADNSPATTCRVININNNKFKNFQRAINIMSNTTLPDSNALINIDNCHYNSDVTEASCIQVSSPVELINIRANSAKNVYTFLHFGGASSGNISCRDISCPGVKRIFDIGPSDGILTLTGNISTDSDAILFQNMMGKLHSNIIWNLIPSGASFGNAPIGELYDGIHPTQYIVGGYSLVNSKLTLTEVRNIRVDWSSSTNNLNEIVNGVKGQLLYITSSTNKSIMNVTNKIILSDSSIALSTYKGILLRYDGIKWVQIG